MEAVKRLGIVLGFGTLLLSSLLLFLLSLYWFYVWWGILGVFAGIVVAPLAAIFPFIFLFKEGFSLFYFGIWIIGIAGRILAVSLSR